MSARRECYARVVAGLVATMFCIVSAAADPLSIAAPGSRPTLMFDQYLQDQDASDGSHAASGLPAALRRQIVPYAGREPAGTIIIDTPRTYLYYVLGGGRALRYGIGVGRDGFRWSGIEAVSRMAEWPDWIPPADMIRRQPYLPRFMAGGATNPLGARALYLGNTEYRVHGTNDPSSIGKHVSSGCIRMTNDDVIDLYDRVKIGTRVVVLADPARLAAASTRRTTTVVERTSMPAPAPSPAAGNTPSAFRLY